MKLLLSWFLLSLFASPVFAQDKVTLQLKWFHAFQFAGYYTAKEKGFYQDEGLDVAIREAGPGVNVTETVMFGRADYGVGTSSLLLDRNNENPVVVLAVIFQHSPLVLVTLQNSATQSIHNVISKKVMLEEHSDEILAYLARERIPLEQLVFVDHSFDLNDLIDGSVDVISAYVTNERFYLEKEGLSYHTYTPRSAGIDFYGDNLFTSEQEIEDNPERVEAFRRASLKGWQYAMAHPEEIVDIILDKYPTKHSRDFLLFEAQEMSALLQPELIEVGYMQIGRWQHIVDTFTSLNMLPDDFDVSELLYKSKPDSSFSNNHSFWITVMTIVIIALIALYIYWLNRKLNRALRKLASLHNNMP